MKLGYFRNNTVPWFIFLFLLLAIPVTVKLGQEAQNYLARAAVVPANIIIDASLTQGEIPRIWEAAGQGGELEFDNRTLVKVSPALSLARNLGIKYIRLDHILNWPLEERLAEIKAIKDAGLVPVIALSYFPTSVATTDTGDPYNWAAWQEAVSNLIMRVSGGPGAGLNIANVYYEVWNEPDGKTFGNMSPEEYLTLYRSTVNAAGKVAPKVNPFKIGGPALANPDNKDWLDKFITLAEKYNLRLDFVSWHRYSRDINVFTSDLDVVDSILEEHPRYIQAEKLITEWGSDPANNSVHGTNYDSAHFAAVTRVMLGRVTIAAKFEVRDGVTSKDLEGLGILSYHGSPKPLAKIYELLAKMRGKRIFLAGEGSNVTGFGLSDGDKIKIMIVNYDRRVLNTEDVPIRISGLTPGNWNLKKTIIDGYNYTGKTEANTLVLPGGSISYSQVLGPNSVLFLELDRGQ